jgi:hypothetical protein
MHRLVCVVEGHGDVAAVPVLCHRVLRKLLAVTDWYVDENPIRLPRSQLVDEKQPSPKRPPSGQGIERALQLAARRGPRGILVVCDADDDCPAAWGPKVPAQPAESAAIKVAAVMASREFESWLLWGFSKADRLRVRAANPDRSPRDARSALRRLVGGYSPGSDQADRAAGLDLARAWAGSDSFDKFVRSIAWLSASNLPPRPKLVNA